MEIRDSFVLDAPREQVARLLVDVPVVAGCVPGVQDVERQEDGSWSAVMAAQLGPIKARFAGTVSVDDSEAPERLSARGQGSDRGTGSQVSVSMAATLTEQAGATVVDIVADVVIRGRLGQFGTGIIRATAQEMTKVFVASLSERLADDRNAAAASALEEPSTSGAPAVEGPVGGTPGIRAVGRDAAVDSPPRIAAVQVSPVRIVLRGLLAWAATSVRRLLRRREK
ncbi:MAG TPA: SRPBCC domain-containing protein [Blastococcus sp.]|jgi:carbon monoxide dehydrogenase subunit G